MANTISRMRKARLDRKLSLTALTARTQIGTSTLSALERGQTPAWPGWRRRIAEALHVREGELFDGQAVRR